MRQKQLLLTCVLGFLLLSGRDASAFWKYIGELSGPGYFLGVDFIFPFTIRPPVFDPVEFNDQHNSLTLRRLGLELPELFPVLPTDRLSQSYCEFLARTLAAEVGEVCTPPAEGEVRTFSEFVVRSDTLLILRDLGVDLSIVDPATGGRRALREGEELSAEKSQEAVLNRANRMVSHQLSQFGAGQAGLFGSQQPLPKFIGRNCNTPLGGRDPSPFKDCKGKNKNFFFTFALGAAYSIQNDLLYAPDHDGDTDVMWISLYPALEKRFRIGSGENFSVFWNGGIALNRWVGAGFDDFSRVSAKTRAGLRMFGTFYVGGEFEVFNESIPNSQFGSISPGELDSTSWGFFFAVELVRPMNN